MNSLDKEWIELIAEAKAMGMTVEDVRLGINIVKASQEDSTDGEA